jgi:pyruvate carboxylase
VPAVRRLQAGQALKAEVGLPIHFHTHDTSGVASASVLRAADAGVDVVDLALASMSGSTSQPNLNSVVAALQHTPRDTGLDLDRLNELSDYWEHVREFYRPFDTAPRTGSAEVYLHEMPGGQYTNLKEQAASMAVAHRWPEIARTYAEVNQLFGDIVKVTPSSKVVGDMALFLFSRGIKPADVVNLEPGSMPFPGERDRHAHRRARLARGRVAGSREPGGARPEAARGGAREVRSRHGRRARAGRAGASIGRRRTPARGPGVV